MLLADQGTAQALTAVQTLAAVRELGPRFASLLVARQAVAAVLVTLVVAWGDVMLTGAPG